jgi:hypothetical protein
MITHAKLQQATPAEKAYKLAGAGGLHLSIVPAGARLWRWRLEVAGRARRLSLGCYLEIDLAHARAAKDEAWAASHAGLNPLEVRKAGREISHGRTFGAIARAWHALQIPTWTADHANDVIHSRAA